MTALAGWGLPGVASIVLGPLQFDRPEWFILLAILLPLVVLMGRGSIAGLDGITRWIAFGVRLVVVGGLVAVLAEPSLRRVGKDVGVTVILDASRSVPLSMQQEVDRFLEGTIASKKAGDRVGVITVARDALVQRLPTPGVREVERRTTGDLDATNLSEGLSLAMAVAPKDAAARFVIASDGNETAGSLLQAARAAIASGHPVDVLPLRYRYPQEVIVERVIAPATARQGQVVSVRVVLSATAPARGMLFLSMDGEGIDISPEDPSLGAFVELEAGQNIFSREIYAGVAGPRRFEARFEPEIRGGRAVGDSLAENNRALGVTFVSGEGKILVVREDPSESELLVRELRASGLGIEETTADLLAGDLTGMSAYDAIILCNEPAYNFSNAQIEGLRRYVHDLGGGLAMVGGPESFGAGGWIGSGLAEALPIRLDPPNKRQMPRGALALVMHSIEMPNGVYYGRQVANAAVDALSRLDLAGIIEFNPMTSRQDDWVHPLSPVGDRSAIKRSINRLTFGDMPSFNPSLQKALDGLKAADAGQRHVIVISDGDPSLNRSLIDEFRSAKITISTVGVNPHSRGDLNGLRFMADRTGGKFYDVGMNYSDVVKIFFKEAQMIRRSLIWEGPAIMPSVIASGSDPMREIGAVPAITGYVVAADREGLSVVTLRAGSENDPIAAHWQHGLGRVFCVTTDATSRWARAWVNWPGYRKFWEQHVRWAMRPSGSANIRIVTESEGDRTLVTVEALNADGERLATGAFEARVAGPDGSSHDLALRQVGRGRWEGGFDSALAGTYVLATRFAAPGVDGGEGIRGVAQAAVTRPYADEFRALEDNAALLVQVAQMTGGRVLDPGSPAGVDLFDRSGLTMPVATRAVWLPLLIGMIALFLVDVGVRRVRIEAAAIVAAVRRSLRARDETRRTQVDALRAARSKAQERFDGQGPDKGETGVSRRRFEVDEETLQRQGGGGIHLVGEQERAERGGRERAKEPESGEGMSRLMAAKRRAREGLEEDRKDG